MWTYSQLRRTALMVLITSVCMLWSEAKAIGGSGTSSSPYTISSSNDMNEFKSRIESGNYNDKYWKVTNDIRWGGEGGTNHRIGWDSKPFKGTFDGGGFKIDIGNIQNGSGEYTGFFGCADNFTVKNFTLQYTYIDCRTIGGGLIGEARGNVTIDNVHIIGTSTSDIYGTVWGGLLGKVWRGGQVNISSCSVNIAKVILHQPAEEYFDAGGLIGWMQEATSTKITDCMTNVNFGLNDPNSPKKGLGGIMGSASVPVTMIRCFSGSYIPNVGSSLGRGYILGHMNANVTAYNTLNSFSNKSFGNIVGGKILSGVGYDWWASDWSRKPYFYTDLERKDDQGRDKSSYVRGNEKWGFDDNTQLPKLSNTGYAVRVYKGNGVNSISEARNVDANYYYTNADKALTIIPSGSISQFQRAVYTFNPDYSPSSGSSYTAEYEGNNWKLKARVNGTVSAQIVNIPNPKNTAINFNQWNSKVTLSWSVDNPQNLTGKWGIYKRLNFWDQFTRVENTMSVQSGTKTHVRELTISKAEFEKNWQYVVCFEESNVYTSSPTSRNHQLVFVSTVTSIGIDLKTEEAKNFIKFSFKVPTQLDNNSTYKYKVFRKKVEDLNFTELTNDLVFNSTKDKFGYYTYTDNEPTSACDRYLYKIEIPAFDKVFSKTISNAVGITGGTEFISVKASKGEYAGYVRIVWSTTKIDLEAVDRFRIFRRVATNPDDKGVEVATISTKDLNYIYTDNNILPGIYYNYDVVLYQICGGLEKELSREQDIGFSQSLGSVSGRITYGTGQAVKDVGVSVLRNDLQGNETQYNSLESKGEGGTLIWKSDTTYFKSLFSKDFSYQFWLNPSAANTGADVKVADISEVFSLFLNQTGNNYYLSFMYYDTTNVVRTISNSAIKIEPSRFSHIAVTRSNNVLKVYVVNDRDLTNITVDSIMVNNARKSFSTPASRSFVNMGYEFKGNIDEVRLWSKTLSSASILRDHNRMLTGSESGLKAYWTLDEGLPGHFFDISKVGTVFNGNHGTTTLESSSVIPENEQLALKAITDSDGNYQIRGIPFSGEGCSYDVVPSLGVHEFNPTRQLRYISNSSLVHNNTDFKDISAFVLSGEVTYEGGNYPVEGCTFEIDDKIVVSASGEAVKSDVFGKYSISVPIGEHKIRIRKSGHTFVNDGLLIDAENQGNKNFNKPETANFFDNTKVKLIGRIVGGLNENDKVLGFGESVNNIGAKTNTLTAAKAQYDLISLEKADTVLHNTGDWKKASALQNDTTHVRFKPKTIEIDISRETGEFVAWVYPETYTIGKVEDENYAEAFYAGGENLDLTTAPVPSAEMLKENVRTWTDSVYVSGKGVVGHFKPVEKSDTITYHQKWTHYYQATPTFNALQLAGSKAVEYFGEMNFTITNDLAGTKDTLELVSVEDDIVSYMFDKPVFIQGKNYKFKFNAYEEYKNYSKDETIRYAVKDGTVNLSNTIDLNNPEPLELDSLGNAIYQFMAGAPDLTTGAGAFMGTVQIGSVSYYWDRGNSPIETWHLGDKSTGTDFMTAGPNQITAILRDPPGSLSNAYIEEGSTVTTRSSLSGGIGVNTEMNLTTSLGPKIDTWVGFGAGVMTANNTLLDISVGLRTETKLTSGTETEQTTTFTERFETSDDPLYVGNRGDVFIGNSTNIQYGLTNGITIQKDYTDAFEDGSGDAFSNKTAGASTFSIAPRVSLAYGQNFDTRFAFTQVEIEEIMIPKWQDNLAILLKPINTGVNLGSITSPVYVSKLAHDDENFGKLNTDKDAFGSAASSKNRFDDGPSYKIYFPATYNKADFKVDSVMWFNNQIEGWTTVLRQNEQEKVNMKKLGNYSFGAGASISYSKTSTASKTTTTTFNTMINPSIGLAVGGEVMGIGLELSTSVELVAELEYSNGTTKESTVSSGFTLKEEGDDDEITVDYGMTASGTIAFRTRGGRTSCPHEEVQYSKYYQAGQHILSEGTMQIEVPKIDIQGSDQALAVPSNKTAKFNLAMKNESETGEDVWFQLIVDESTNPNGAELKIDGGGIGNGRMFLVKAGEVLNKVLSVGKGTADLYENIGLVLRSECQSDPTDFMPDIADTVRIKRIEFVPACSEVAIKTPVNNWIVNTKTGDVLDVVLEGYDVNFVNFGYVQLEYRSVSETDWKTLNKFYGNENIFNKVVGTKELIPSGTQRIKYAWNQNTMPDGQYELRAKAICVNVDGDYKIIQEISEFTTEAVSGRKDMSIPQALGSPSPANGIYAIGDDIAITFNENIRTGLLTSNNFSIKAILNGEKIAEPVGGLAMSGTDVAYTELPIYNNGTFSIETWFKRDNNTEGTVFSYGLGDNTIALAFDTQGHAIVTIGNETKTSINTISNTTRTWKYVGLSYNVQSKTVSVYAWQDSDPTILLFEQEKFVNIAPTQGRLYSGAKIDGSNGFKGALALMHFYDTNRNDTDMAASKSENKSGTEKSLVGLWKMDEGEGTVAVDKARSRNMVVSGAWYLYPAGKSIALDGATQYATIPGDKCAFRPYDDFSIEFWFKAASQNAATLFAIGNAMDISFDATHNLILNTAKGSQKITSTNLLDDKWHHVALSVKRHGSTNALIDGKVVSTFATADVFESSVGGGFCYLGVRYSEDHVSGTKVYDQYLKGNIDELRVWNNALTTGAVVLNKNNKLSGTEDGLLAYYPFEKWTKNPDGSFNVLEWTKDMSDETFVLAGNSVISTVAVGLQDVRPVKNVAHSFTSSDNKVVLNITEDLYKIEAVTLEVSVKGIFDMYGNESKPITWVAYVDRNSLNWGTSEMNFSMQESEDLSFTAVVSNTGAVRADYFIEDLPNWLTVSSTQGNLLPLSSKTLTFTVSPRMNIGSYEASIALTGTNDVRKVLAVRLKVTGQKADWTVNPNDFENSMNITGKILIDNRPKEDSDDLLAAFIGDKCVGVTSPIYVGVNNAYFTFADIYGNVVDNNKAITFKLWEASTGRIYPELVISENDIRFVANQTLGTINAPVVFNAVDVIEQTIPLKKGWTWMSTNLINNNPIMLAQMKNSLADVGVIIKGRESYIQQPAWAGTLTNISEKAMYVVNTTQDHAMKLKGQPAAPELTSIEIKTGWNWISYIPSFNASVKNALAGLNATDGEQIKGQVGYATYSTINGWIGSLTHMQAGKGYMYHSNNATAQNFVYPSAVSQQSKAYRVASNDIETKWNGNNSKYASSMTITAAVLNNNVQLRSDKIEVAAFCGAECRGSIMLQNVESLDEYLGFLMIYGENNEEISLRVYNHENNEEMIANNANLVYTTDAIYGSPDKPYQISLGTTDIDNLLLSTVSLFPNPVVNDLHIARSWDVIDLLEIMDMSGRSMIREHKFNKSTLRVSALESGMYILKLTQDKEVRMIKFIKE